MTTKDKWQNLREEGAMKIIRAPILVRFSEGMVRFLLGAVLAGVELPGGYAPLGAALVGASGSGIDGFCALLGAVFGTLYFWGFSAGLRDMAAAVLIFSVAFAFYDVKLYQRSWFMPGVTGALVMLTGFATFTKGTVTAWGSFCFGGAVIWAGGAAYVDRVVLSSRGWPGAQGMTGRQKTAVLLFGITLLMALERVVVLDGLSLGRILAAAVVLGVASLGGPGMGAAVGIGVGLAMDLTAGERLYAIALGISGLTSGAFRRQGRLACTAAFVLADGGAVLWMWDRALGCEELLYEVFLACVAFLSLPERLFRKVALYLSREEKEHWAPRRAYVKERLEGTAKAFHLIYESLRESFSREGGEGEEPPFKLFDRAAQKVCIRCTLRERCWQSDYQSTAGALNDALVAMLERGKGRAEDFPLWFTSRCPRFGAFLETVNEELTALLYRRRYQARLMESRAAVCGQYGELSRVLEDAALELSQELVPEPVRERRLGRWLAGQEIEGEWSVFFDERGRLRAEILTREGERVADEESRKALTELFHTPLRPAQVKQERGKSRVIYTQAEPLAATAGVAARKKDGELVSGDAGTWFKGEDGVLWLLLCDGMGSGQQANRESALAIRLLESFLRAGMAPEDALRTLNSALALRSEAEGGFTTVDLCRVDLFTGAGSVYKFGAAPTYIKKEDTVLRITGTALPAGLTAAGERVDPDVTPFRLEPGDCLLLLTDGVSDGEEDEWLRQALKEFDGQSPKELARKLLEQGRARAVSADDSTVLVVRIGKREP